MHKKSTRSKSSAKLLLFAELYKEFSAILFEQKSNPKGLLSPYLTSWAADGMFMLYHPSTFLYLPRMGVVGDIYLQIDYRTSLPLHTVRSFYRSRYTTANLQVDYRPVASPHGDSS